MARCLQQFRRALGCFLLITATPALCTTVIQIVTPTGIVLATDSKVVGNAGQNEGDSPKLFILKSRFAVAAADLTSVEGAAVRDFSGVHRFDYSAGKWLQEVADTLPDNVSIEALTDAVARKADLEFAPYRLLIRAGMLSQQNDHGEMLARFWICGYSGGVAQIFRVL